MKKASSFILAFIGAWVFAFCGPAHAVTFTISDIAFTDLIGANEALRWTVTPVASPFTFDLTAGNSWTFTYGTFAIQNAINSNTNDADDSFKASFNVTSPTPASEASSVAKVAAIFTGDNNTSYGDVDFNNDAIVRIFGIDGVYSIFFLDPAHALKNHVINLQAKIVFDKDTSVITDPDPGPTVPVPAPEPGTIILLGAGLAGLILCRKKITK